VWKNNNRCIQNFSREKDVRRPFVVSSYKLEYNIKWMLEERHMMMWIGFIWLNIGTTSGVS
jgi:hypothetical protein